MTDKEQVKDLELKIQTMYDWLDRKENTDKKKSNWSAMKGYLLTFFSDVITGAK